MSLQVNMCVSCAQHQRPKPALNTVTRSVADVALERRAETGVGGSEEGERAGAQAAPAVDLDVSPDQHRVGSPGANTRGPSSLERHVDRRALRLSSTFMEVALKADP
jgi:hypothetical protein